MNTQPIYPNNPNNSNQYPQRPVQPDYRDRTVYENAYQRQGYYQQPAPNAPRPVYGGAATVQKDNTGKILGIIGGVIGLVLLVVIIMIITLSSGGSNTTATYTPSIKSPASYCSEYEAKLNEMEKDYLNSKGDVKEEKINTLLKEEYNYISTYNETHHTFTDVKMNETHKTIDCYLDDGRIYRHFPGKNSESQIVDDEGNVEDTVNPNDADSADAETPDENSDETAGDSNASELDSTFLDTLCSDRWYISTVINGGCQLISFEFNENGAGTVYYESEGEEISESTTLYAKEADCATFSTDTDTYYIYNNDCSNNVFTYESNYYKGVISRLSLHDSTLNDYSVICGTSWYSDYFNNTLGVNELYLGEASEDEQTLAFFTDGEFYSDYNLSGTVCNENMYHFCLPEGDLNIYVEANPDSDSVNAFIFDGGTVQVETWSQN